MPRIPDQFLDCVVYLYPDEPSANSGKSAGGSGFIVGIALGFSHDIAKEWFSVIAVTNKHVVDNGNTTVRINTVDGHFDVLEIPNHHWLRHPAHDLAIAPIGLQKGQHKFMLVYSPHNFVTEGLIQELKIGIGDECFVLGRFVNHEGTQQNSPSVRFGCIAQMPGEKIRLDDGSEQESFLVEAKSISGYSGSPVFVYIPPFDGFTGGRASVSMARGPWLLGVDHCHLFMKEPLRDAAGQVLGRSFVRSNTGMMGVVPAWRLQEMFSLPDMRSILETDKEEAMKESEKIAGSATGEQDG